MLDGDHYVLNGQKVWTSMAHVAAWGFFLVRTDPTAAKHKGITFLLLDMKSPGLTIRPLRQITGEAEFNEVFLENVRVPATNVVGKVNEGWGVALTTLAYERDVLTMIRHISLRTALHKLLALAQRTMKNGRPASEDPVVRQKIAALSIGERVLQLNGYRSLTKILRGGAPGPEGSTSKLFWSQLDQELAELATEIIGPYSQIKAGSRARARRRASGSSTACWRAAAASAPAPPRSSATSWASACSACRRTESHRRGPMADSELLYEVKDRIATITLNRPDKMNAFTGPMIERWAASLARGAGRSAT